MTYILKELSFRCFYVGLFYALIAFLSYLSYGCQLEYFQGLDHLSQSSTFCYHTVSWQWLEQNNATALNVTNHASKAWKALSLPCLGCLSPLVMTCKLYVFLHSLLFYVGFVTYHLMAFFNPAFLATSMTRSWLLWHFALMLCSVYITLLLNAAWLLWELNIEPLDSELIKPQTLY